jgi:hypothetical protein
VRRIKSGAAWLIVAVATWALVIWVPAVALVLAAGLAVAWAVAYLINSSIEAGNE